MEFFIDLPWIDISLWLLALICIAAGFVGMVLPAIPGPPILFAGLIFAAWAEDFVYVGWGTLLVLGALCIAAIALDFIAGAMGAKRYGASPAAITGALLGAFAGIFLGPIGLLMGPFFGAVLGELLMGAGAQQAGRAGFGATLGMLIGIVAKLVIGVVMLSTFALVRWL